MDDPVRTPEDNFGRFFAAHPQAKAQPAPPREPPAPAPPPPGEPAQDPAFQTQDLGPPEEAVTCWLESEERFVSWQEWRAKTPFAVEVSPADPLRSATAMEATFPDGRRVQLRETGGRWEHFLFSRQRRQWLRQRDSASPSSEHARRWTESLYGPPASAWKATERREATPPPTEAEPEF